MRNLIVILFVLGATEGQAQGFETDQCARAERGKIRSAMRWLLDAMPRYERHLKSPALSDWSGRSRARFVDRLKKRSLKFRCERRVEKCTGSAIGYTIEFDGKSLPVMHKSPIVICTTQVTTVEEYALVIGHELAHLVWVNAHRRQCADKCLKPRLSRSLEVAILNEYRQTAYDPTECLVQCGEELPGLEPNVVVDPSGVPSDTPDPSVPAAPSP
ncbi:MAG: hypothetical protein VX589_02710 [Myxococcota bacterium]|nr:hypothetical protein [Myxococcota bacterium]